MDREWSMGVDHWEEQVVAKGGCGEGIAFRIEHGEDAMPEVSERCEYAIVYDVRVDE